MDKSRVDWSGHGVQSEADILSEKLLSTLAERFGDEWKYVAISLNFTTDVIEQLQRDYKSTKDQIFFMLIKWKQRRGHEPGLVEELCSALKQQGRKDVADDLQKQILQNQTQKGEALKEESVGDERATGPEEKTEYTRTEPDEILDQKCFQDSTSRMFTGKCENASNKESEGDNTGETDEVVNLHFAQVVMSKTDAEKARQRAKMLLEEEIRIVFVGKTGVGKSATANTILRRNHFPSDISFKSVTQKCTTARTEYKGKTVQIIDTPGIFAVGDKKDEVEEEIKRCIHLGAPGLHAILFVIEYGRFRKDDLESIETFLEYFGKEMKKFIIVVFTHVDKMKDEHTIDEMIHHLPELKNFIEECGHRCCKFNNMGSSKEKETQIGHLFAEIRSLKTTNDLIYFTDESIKRAEERVVEKVEQVERTNLEECKLKYEQERKTFQEKLKNLQSDCYNSEECVSEKLVTLDVGEESTLEHLQVESDMIEKREKKKPTDDIINKLKDDFETKLEKLRREYERNIEHARERARKEFEENGNFKGFSIRKILRNFCGFVKSH